MSVQVGVLSDRERLLYGVSAQLQHKGANPRALFEVMARVIDEYGEDGGADFSRDCHATVGIGLDYLSRILALVDPMERESTAVAFEHEAIRGTVAKWAMEATPPARHAKGGPIPANVSDTHVRDRSPAYPRPVLKRDDPVLAQAVIDGDLTPNAAAVRAGIRHSYARVRTDDPARAVAVLLRHYTREQLAAALAAT